MKKKICFLLSAVFMLLFILLIVLLHTVDIKDAGLSIPSTIGLSTINFWFRSVFEYNDVAYSLTNWTVYLAFVGAGCYALVGAYQLFTTKSLKKVDLRVIFLGILYLIVITLYFLFDKIALNYRPVMIDGELKASFPSTHTMVVLVVLITSLPLNAIYIKNKITKKIVNILAIVLSAYTLICRVICGVHWLTDIIGSIFISSSFIFLYYGSLELVKELENK